MNATIKEEAAAYIAETADKIKMHGHPEFRGGAFAIVPAIFLRSPDFSCYAKTLYSVLITFVGENTECWPGQTRLCAHLGLSQPTFRKALKELVDAGLVRVKKGGDGQTCHYEVDKYEGYQSRPNPKSRLKENDRSENIQVSDRKSVSRQTEKNGNFRLKPAFGNIKAEELNTEDIKKESAVLSMEDDANAEAVASFSSHSDLVGEEATGDGANRQDIPEPSKGRAEQTENEKPTPKANTGYVPRGRASVTPEVRRKMETAAKAFYELQPKDDLNLNAEITKYHGELAALVGKVSAHEWEAAIRTAQERFAPPLQITIKSVWANYARLMEADGQCRQETLSPAALAPKQSTVAPDPGFAAFMAKIKK